MPDLGDTNDREFDGPGSEDGSFGSPPEPDADPIEEAADTPAEEPEGEDDS